MVFGSYPSRGPSTYIIGNHYATLFTKRSKMPQESLAIVGGSMSTEPAWMRPGANAGLDFFRQWISNRVTRKTASISR